MSIPDALKMTPCILEESTAVLAVLAVICRGGWADSGGGERVKRVVHAGGRSMMLGCSEIASYNTSALPSPFEIAVSLILECEVDLG
jgi:hypothetical protein